MWRMPRVPDRHDIVAPSSTIAFARHYDSPASERGIEGRTEPTTDQGTHEKLGCAGGRLNRAMPLDMFPVGRQ